MRKLIENNFGLVLILACLAGLIVPGMPALPGESAIAALALLMFISCYKLRDGGFAQLRWGHIALFYALRYSALPVVLWLIARTVAPDYAVGVFLLSMVPAGVSSPAIATIYGGAVAPGFAIVLISQLLAPLLIPAQFAWLSQTDSSVSGQVLPDPLSLFKTMVFCILLPMAFYALVKKQQRLAAYVTAHHKWWSMLLIAFVIALAVAKQREVILGDISGVMAALMISLFCYIIYMLFGWWAARGQRRDVRITYAVCSGFNNAALAVSLGLLHFGPQVVLFVAVSEVGWSLLPLIFKRGLRLLRD